MTVSLNELITINFVAEEITDKIDTHFGKISEITQKCKRIEKVFFADRIDITDKLDDFLLDSLKAIVDENQTRWKE